MRIDLQCRLRKMFRLVAYIQIVDFEAGFLQRQVNYPIADDMNVVADYT